MEVRVSMYAAISATPDFPLDRQLVIQYSVALLLLRTPYMIQALQQ
jgi:hypothetical protein